MITQSYLKDILHYCPETGIFTRNKQSGNALQGSVAGWSCDRGYIFTRIRGKNYQCHRLAWLYMTGAFPKEEIDHINHNKGDNRFSNLQEATRAENSKNRPLYINSSSGVAGVTWNKFHGKWRAHIRIEGKQKHLGLFDDKDDAIQARKDAEKKHGFHPNHGKQHSLAEVI